MEVKGRNLAEGIPRSFTVSSNEILEALTDPLNSIVSAVKSALERTPPELGADIAERGMVLTGRRRAAARPRPPADGGDRPAGDRRRRPAHLRRARLRACAREHGQAADDLHLGLLRRRVVAREADASAGSAPLPYSAAGALPRSPARPMRHLPAEPPAFFHRGPSPLARLAFFGLLSIGAAAVRRRALRLPRGIRLVCRVVLYPLQRRRSVPGEALARSTRYFASQRSLADRERRAAAAAARAGRGGAGVTRATRPENERLRALLDVRGGATRPAAAAVEVLYSAATRSRRSSSSTSGADGEARARRGGDRRRRRRRPGDARATRRWRR